jgi:hypothetical protein
MRKTFGALLAAGIAAAMIGACASPGPKIQVQKDPVANLGAYKTFNFFSPLGTDRDGYESIVSATLKEVTTNELVARGYAMSETPDFLVNFGGKLNEKMKVSSSPAAPMPGPYWGYYGYRYGYYDPFYRPEQVNVSQYTEGTLTLDIVDAKSKRLVWESVAVGKVTDKVRENVPGTLRVVVPQMMAEYPAAAP